MTGRWKGIRTLEDPAGWQNNPSFARRLQKDIRLQLNLLWLPLIDRPEWLQRNGLTLPEVAACLLQPSWWLHSGSNYRTIEGDSSTNVCWQPHPHGRCSNNANIRLRIFFFSLSVSNRNSDVLTSTEEWCLWLCMNEPCQLCWLLPCCGGQMFGRNGSWLVLVVFWRFCASPQVWRTVCLSPRDHPSHKVQDPPHWGGRHLNINCFSWLAG